MNWILNRLKERSTWAALVTLAGLVGIKLDPFLQEQIITLGVTLIAIIFAVTKDKQTNTTVVNNDPVTLVAQQTVVSPELTDEQKAILSNP